MSRLGRIETENRLAFAGAGGKKQRVTAICIWERNWKHH